MWTSVKKLESDTRSRTLGRPRRRALQATQVGKATDSVFYGPQILSKALHCIRRGFEGSQRNIKMRLVLG